VTARFEREVPETRYARSGDLYLGYQVWGDGPIDVLEMNNGANFSIDATVDEPHWLRYERRLSAFCRLVRYDARGFGLSDGDPAGTEYSLDPWVDDALAVLDAEDIDRAAVTAGSFGGFAAMALAAAHPERVSALVLMNCTARIAWAEDYPIGWSPEVAAALRERARGPVTVPSGETAAGTADATAIEATAIEAAGIEAIGYDDVALLAPSLAGDPDFRRWWGRATRRSASPTTAQAINAAVFSADCRHVLEHISVPTLVLTRRDFVLGPAMAKNLADHIPGARYVEVPGGDLLPFAGDSDLLLDEVEEFLTGGRASVAAERVLATVVFTDVVGSTAMASGLGDRRWRALLDDLDNVVRSELERHRGRLVKDTGDGTLTTFAGPADAIRFALAVRGRARPLGVELRAGLHAGEVEVRGDDIGGISVHVAARVVASAQPGEVLVSSTVADLVAGSGIAFDDRGSHELRGVIGERRLLAVVG
jgi:pimeloyl-ACP methyl ester carboxylesterase